MKHPGTEARPDDIDRFCRSGFPYGSENLRETIPSWILAVCATISFGVITMAFVRFLDGL